VLAPSPAASHLLLVLKLDQPLGVAALLPGHPLLQHSHRVHILKHVDCRQAGVERQAIERKEAGSKLPKRLLHKK
jgi:hypothetical protein